MNLIACVPYFDPPQLFFLTLSTFAAVQKQKELQEKQIAVKPSFGDLMLAVRTEGHDVKKVRLRKTGQPKANTLDLLSAIRTEGREAKHNLKKAPATRAELFASINQLRIATKSHADETGGPQDVSIMSEAGLKKAKTASKAELLTSIRLEGLQLKQKLNRVTDNSVMPTMEELRKIRQQQKDLDSPRSPNQQNQSGSGGLVGGGSGIGSGGSGIGSGGSGSGGSPVTGGGGEVKEDGAWYPENMTSTRAAAIGSTFVAVGRLDTAENKKPDHHDEATDAFESGDAVAGKKVVRRNSSVFMDKVGSGRKSEVVRGIELNSIEFN